ncbi:MAG: hypothetical protein MZU91_15140 [Desulfosudis oleivorans]|nr:hypothetical protein [Desulfosudis oleivorans]
MSTLQRYMDKRIKRCLSNPAILVLALVYLASAKRRNPQSPTGPRRLSDPDSLYRHRLFPVRDFIVDESAVRPCAFLWSCAITAARG